MLTRVLIWFAAFATGMGASAASAEQPEANDTPTVRPFRIGACVGLGPECPVAGAKAEVSGRYVGASFSGNTEVQAVSVKAYPISFFDAASTTRLFVNCALLLDNGDSEGLFDSSTQGIGLGADLHFLQSKRLLVQPTVMVQRTCATEVYIQAPPGGGSGPGRTCSVRPAGSISVMAAF